MRPKEIEVTKRRSGLSRQENNEIITALRAARLRGEIPALTYSYNKHPTIFGKDPLYVTPKAGSIGRAAVKVRSALRKQFGTKYSVHMA